MEALHGFKDDGGAWNAAYLDHEFRHYCGGHASDDEVPCSKGDRKHNCSCRKKRSKPRIVGGLANTLNGQFITHAFLAELQL